MEGKAQRENDSDIQSQTEVGSVSEAGTLSRPKTTHQNQYCTMKPVKTNTSVQHMCGTYAQKA